ncbi:WXG100 family type VII secretion target [Nocardia vinacea]|uniref:WXG100 family type VII secretion target n=1 Tax=Nocardia vinacea TaxID=96468 RepID=UPI00340AA72D
MKMISANFSGVEENAQRLITRAENIRDELISFHQKVEEFTQTHAAGKSNDAFIELQTTWNMHVQQLQETLNGAGMLVKKGNAELQDMDVALAKLY